MTKIIKSVKKHFVVIGIILLWGSLMVLFGIVFLAVNPENSNIANDLSNLGMKILIFGYPVYLIYLFFKMLIKNNYGVNNDV